MIFRDTGLDGPIVIDPEPIEDARGRFARIWCREEFRAHGIEADPMQCATSYSHRRGTLRGLHYQAEPHAEAKLVRCTRGRIFDVAVDLRPASPTRGRWTMAELSAETGRMLFIPEGFAHGFQTLEDDTEVFYQISIAYVPESVRGLRWDDPDIGIEWPLPDPILSERDRVNPPLFELSS